MSCTNFPNTVISFVAATQLLIYVFVSVLSLGSLNMSELNIHGLMATRWIGASVNQRLQSLILKVCTVLSFIKKSRPF